MGAVIAPNSNQLSTKPANTLEAAILEGSQFPKASLNIAAEATTRLIGCYPSGKPSDPETYVAAVAAVLSEYPQEIIARVTDPRFGLARRLKFLPAVAEVADACEVEMVPFRRRWREEQRRREDEQERALRARALPDAQAEARIVEGLAKLSADLKATVDPHHRRVEIPAVSEHARRVIDDLARRKASNEAVPHETESSR